MELAATRRTTLAAALVAAALSSCASPGAGKPAGGAPAPADYAPLVAAPDRTEEDRALDPGRRPAELLAFAGVRPGMRVAELGAATGYTAELLARAVGPGGVVWAQNNRTLLEIVGGPWARRLERPAMRGVIRVDREFEDPLPPEAHDLDIVMLHATYHDLLWLDADRARMNRAIAAALRPGGVLVVIDHRAKDGAGRDDAYDFHRVDPALVRREVEAAGLRLEGTSDAWRHPEDTLDWSTAPNEAKARRGTSDRFALRFVRP